ncbi:cysteine hydrolase family protein [Isobaculum melis]|uniref:Nicotinamidase-related amidase n=1 Tax=Isobaculum melis TaxID=142588 RepID=A0A1H9T0L6_9LACT|nr:cysteine hydrolase family protein [Isobaculum melis]SER90279.1 Nicotinamidase-related amidase [Isobaculum melis]
MGNKALIIIDLQKGLDIGLYRLDEVLAGVNKRIAHYRSHDLPIIFVQHEGPGLDAGSENWELMAALDAQSEDFYIGKKHPNSFFETDLKALLDRHEISELEFCGAQTQYCVDTTIRMAHGLGYHCTMKKGLSTTLNDDLLGAKTILEHHENIWNHRFLTFI